MNEVTSASRGRGLITPAVIGLSLSMLMASLDTSIANAGLPTLARAFGASFPAAQWIVLSYLLVVTTLIVSVGRLGDVMGRRRLLIVGLSVFTGASAICGGAPELWILIAARAAQGLGAAIMMALTLAFMGETVPKDRIGAAMGLLGTMSAVGTAFGPSLGGILTSALGWRSIFLVNVPVGLVSLYLASRYLPADRSNSKADGTGFDGMGTLLLGVALASYALAITLGRGNFGLLNGALVAVAVLAILLFVYVESHAKSPLLHLPMFRDRVLSTGLVTSLLVSTVIMSTLVVGPFYLSGALGLDAATVGFILSVGPIVVAISGVPAGRLADRFGASRLTLVGLLGLMAGSVLLYALPMSLGVPGYVIPILLITSGYAVFQTANNTSVMVGVEPERRGLVSGMLNLARNLGLITGVSVMGAIFARATGSTAISTAHASAIANGMRTTFAVAAGLIGVALLVSILSRRASRIQTVEPTTLCAG